MMPFGLTNAPVSFQSYINWVPMPYLDITIIANMHDVLVFMRNFFQNERYVREVLKALLKAGLYTKLSKCLFSVICIYFLSFILTDKGVEIEKDHISTI